MNTPDLLRTLNDAQQKAVTAAEGPLLVVAGPGTGKTLTIVRRIAYLIHTGVDPRRILAVTFTNRAAAEMRERAAAIGDGAPGSASRLPFIGTFHLLGLRMLQESRSEDVTLLGREEQVELLSSLLACPARQARKTADRISRVKNFLAPLDGEVQEPYERYQRALREKNALDFDDLIRIPVDLIESGGAASCIERYRGGYRHLIVDEYQDINPAQYRLLRGLAGREGSVCAVGDADQAIYAFRGADLESFLNFRRDFPQAMTVCLTDNYRSTGTIVSAADALIRRNRKRMDRQLTALRDAGCRITALTVPDERAEGGAIVAEIEARMGGTSSYRFCVGDFRGASGEGRPAYRFSDFGVVFRTNAQAKALEEAFSASGIPYQVIGRTGSLQERQREELIASLSSVLHPEGIQEGSGGASKEAQLLTPADLFDPRADAVALMTMHMAKGLEFPVVFVAGVEEGLIPSAMNDDDADAEEERRLLYVAMTRAKDELVLLSARTRFLYGERRAQAPSSFLESIPPELIERREIAVKAKQQKKERQIGLF